MRTYTDQLSTYFFRPVRFPLRWISAFWLMVYGLVIFQDYLYSSFQSTGFYWSEVTLFNGYWLLFIPVTLVLYRCNNSAKWISRQIHVRLLYSSTFSLVISGLHILLFTVYITCFSTLLFSPAHPFLATLAASYSSDFAVTFLVYFLITSTFLFTQPSSPEEITNSETNSATITVKQANQLIRIEISTIQCFRANKPYTEIHTDSSRYLIPQSLTSLEQSLTPSQFLRIHRTAIINISSVKKIISRKNGDYDVVLKNEQTLRMSRHYRDNWSQLLAPSTQDNNTSI